MVCGKPRALATVSGGINGRMEGLKNISFPVIASSVRIWRESWFLMQRYRCLASAVPLSMHSLLCNVHGLVDALLLSGWVLVLASKHTSLDSEVSVLSKLQCQYAKSNSYIKTRAAFRMSVQRILSTGANRAILHDTVY